ncbi:hypothetical protein Tco_1264978 [Tanacetum coccineum]
MDEEKCKPEVRRDLKKKKTRKQTAEAQQRAYLAALKADAAYQNSKTMYGAIGEYFSNYAPNPTRPFMPPAFARPTMPQLSPEWAHLLNPPFPYNQPLQPSYAGPSQYTGPPGYTGPPRYTAPLQPLQPPYVGQFPFTPVNNNTFNNCYNPVMNSNLASTSNSQPELPRFITNPHNNDTRSVDELARDRELAGEDNDVGDNNEEGDNQQSGGDYSEDEEGDNEEAACLQSLLITALEFVLEKRGIANMALLIERVDSGEEGVVLSHGGLGFCRVKGRLSVLGKRGGYPFEPSLDSLPGVISQQTKSIRSKAVLVEPPPRARYDLGGISSYDRKKPQLLI